jgi:predicted house-cleaning noncanonical NTP pyrophosphatase (MazG superfamily)
MSEHSTRSRGNSLSPLRCVLVINEAGPADLSVGEISPDSIGWKACGLSSIPSEWVPPFFVITASCFDGSCLVATIDAWVVECLARSNIGSGQLVMVRSSGTTETMQNRGQLISTSCPPHQVTTTIKKLIPQLPQMLSGKVHWIVQKFVDQKRMGHLSNERRLRLEKRDWVVEFDLQKDSPGRTESFAVRRWRDGTDLPDINLRCSSEFTIYLHLKPVAMWASPFSSRTHFEWVWDGEEIHIVQADVADPVAGVNPRSLLPSKIPSVELASSLNVFHLATPEDYRSYRKLQNAKLYGELGYSMPSFYVIDDIEVMRSILSNQIPPKLKDDLVELTRRPLVIRTDGTNIPAGKHEMLPRSEDLRSYDEARDWLLVKFKSEIEQIKLANDNLCFIAHHFIPSVASAWARAEPGNRIVRIESLWGLPEGLYWYSHDTFEVDTLGVEIGFGRPILPLKYKLMERLRYKGTLIASNENGRWIPYQVAVPHDWSKSISKKSWFFEIAHTTRQVAEREKHPVAVMWFIENQPQATDHEVLPWFHNKSQLGHPKAAPRNKCKGADDITLNSSDDWQLLKKNLDSGKRIERVVVEPKDPELIRNPQFAKELAKLAASKKFVVELSGGILSHAYYVLQREGAQVECTDLFGAEEDIEEYNKLVRDKIPTIIQSRGERTETIQLAGDALRDALRQKLVEEAFEVLDAKTGPELISELADLQEVVRALCRELDISVPDIEEEREEKEHLRGGFEKGLMLIKTATPHSIQKQPSTPISPSLGLTQYPIEPVIEDTANLPAKHLYRRPDLRKINKLHEKLFTFEIEVNKIGEIKETLDFSMPVDNQKQRNFTLMIELLRKSSSVRGVVRIRLRPTQLHFDFPE